MISTLPVLSSCAVVDVLGPRPNSDLLQLAQQALADQSGHADTDPEFAQLRGTQAETLLSELSRLCGTDETGAIPETCEVERGELLESGLSPSGSSDESLEQTLSAVTEVPEESVDLLTLQAVELAAVDQDTELPELPTLTEEDDQAAARDLLKQEYAAEYGLGVAVAFLDPADRPLYDAVLSSIQEHILALQLLLEPTGEVPVAEPGYELTTPPEPGAAAAGTLIRETAANEVLRWQEAASAADGEQWRSFAVDAAAHAGAAQSSVD